jgi:hypothetical protein
MLLAILAMLPLPFLTFIPKIDDRKGITSPGKAEDEHLISKEKDEHPISNKERPMMKGRR